MGKILKIEHLSAYLPYDLRLIIPKSGQIINMQSAIVQDNSLCVVNKSGLWDFSIYNFKPILKRLDLNDILDFVARGGHDSDGFFKWFDGSYMNVSAPIFDIEVLPYGCVQWLLKNHYDVFGLIEAVLAVNANDIE